MPPQGPEPGARHVDQDPTERLPQRRAGLEVGAQLAEVVLARLRSQLTSGAQPIAFDIHAVHGGARLGQLPGLAAAT